MQNMAQIFHINTKLDLASWSFNISITDTAEGMMFSPLISHTSLVKQGEVVALASICRTHFSAYYRKYVAFSALLIMNNVPLLCLLNVL